MKTAERCAAPSCGRFIRRGTMLCAQHATQEAARDADRLSDESERAEAFQRRIAEGNYDALFDEHLSRIMTQAAMAVDTHGLAEELGALRYVLGRLLANADQETDVSKLAANVTRVASVAIQAARAQRAISGSTAQGLTNALTQILSELDAD